MKLTQAERDELNRTCDERMWQHRADVDADLDRLYRIIGRPRTQAGMNVFFVICVVLFVVMIGFEIARYLSLL